MLKDAYRKTLSELDHAGFVHLVIGVLIFGFFLWVQFNTGLLMAALVAALAVGVGVAILTNWIELKSQNRSKHRGR